MIKRLFDISVSFVLLILLFPVISFIAFLVFLKLGRPIIFSQLRPGINNKPFLLYKFRTMNDDKDKYGNYINDEIRLTKFGLLLRATSCDELPTLWNVLKGDMSLVGPRPLLMEYLPLYNKKQARRHDVKPGITGWAQINGRNSISWQKKLNLDIWYVDHQSFWLDVKILILTSKKVFLKEGIAQKGSVTMSKFTGKKN
jgi:lipopolysaccharide/colanic/teichoic acid biosynthesis glycosyltransferase